MKKIKSLQQNKDNFKAKMCNLLHISLKKSLLGDIMTEKSFNTVPVDEMIYASLDGW